MKILIVDDSKAMRMIVSRTLGQAGLQGYSTCEASNGSDALQLIESEKPDLILSDWNMPEMNGIQFLEQVRAAGYDMPFGFVTSESSSETRDQAFAGGAQFLLTKPFSPEKMHAAISPLFVN